MDEETKKILLEVFSILDFSEEEKKKALLDFQKKIAMEVLRLTQHELSREDQEFIANEGSKINDPQHPMVAKIREKLKNLHSVEEYRTMTRGIFKELLPQYVRYMSDSLSAEKVDLLDACLKKLA